MSPTPVTPPNAGSLFRPAAGSRITGRWGGESRAAIDSTALAPNRPSPGRPVSTRPWSTCAAILLTFWIAGCASTPKNPSAARISQAKKSYQKETSVKSLNTYLQGVGLGAAGGAAVGAGIGAAAGNAGTGAAIGAVAGSFIGLAVADHIVDQRKKFADASAHLQACTLAAEKQANASQSFNDVLEAEIANVRAEDQSLSLALRDSKEVLGSMKKDLTDQQRVLENARKESVPDSDVTHHQTQIAAMEREIARLTAHVDRLTAQEHQPVLGGAAR